MPAPTTPATTAKVVTEPSVAPYTKSSIDHFIIYHTHTGISRYVILACIQLYYGSYYIIDDNSTRII